MKKQFSIQESIQFGLSTFGKRPWFFIQLTLLSFFASSILSFVTDFLFLLLFSNTDSFIVPLLKSIAQFLIFGVSLYLYLGITRVYLLVVDGHHPTIHDLFTIKKELFIQYIFLWIMMTVLISFGFFAFIIPGIILALMLQYSILCLLDDNQGFVNAMKMSRLVTKGARLKLFLFFFVSLFLLIIGLFAFFVGVFVAFPVVSLAHTHIYRVLRNQMKDMEQSYSPLPSTS